MCNLYLGFQDEKSTTVSKKGILTLIDLSKKHNRSELAAYLTECIEMTPVGTVLVHQKCHRNFTDHKRVMHRGEEVTELPCKKNKVKFLSFQLEGRLHALWKVCCG